MASTTAIIKGLVILYKHSPWLVAEAQFVNPGKGGAFTRTRLKNLKTDQLIEITFRSGEAVETLETLRKKCQYLYNDGSSYHFMDNESYEQFDFDKAIIADAKKYLFTAILVHTLFTAKEAEIENIPILEKVFLCILKAKRNVLEITAIGVKLVLEMLSFDTSLRSTIRLLQKKNLTLPYEFL